MVAPNYHHGGGASELQRIHPGAHWPACQQRAAFVDFDPAVLQVVSLTTGGVLPAVLRSRVDNTQGRLDFVAGALSAPFPSADFTLATVVFTATQPTAATVLALAAASPRLSNITYGGRVGARPPRKWRRDGARHRAGREQPPHRDAHPHRMRSWRIPVTVTHAQPGGRRARRNGRHAGCVGRLHARRLDAGRLHGRCPRRADAAQQPNRHLDRRGEPG